MPRQQDTAKQLSIINIKSSVRRYRCVTSCFEYDQLRGDERHILPLLYNTREWCLLHTLQRTHNTHKSQFIRKSCDLYVVCTLECALVIMLIPTVEEGNLENKKVADGVVIFNLKLLRNFLSFWIPRNSSPIIIISLNTLAI